MVEKTLDIRVRALVGPEMARIQEHLRSIGAITDRGNQSLTRKAAVTRQATQETQKLSKAERVAAVEAGNLMNAVNGGIKSLEQLAQKTRLVAKEDSEFKSISDAAADSVTRHTQEQGKLNRSLLSSVREYERVTNAADKSRAATERLNRAMGEFRSAGPRTRVEGPGASLTAMEALGAAQVGPVFAGALAGRSAALTDIPVQRAAMGRLSGEFREVRQQVVDLGREERAAFSQGTQAAERHRRSIRGLGADVQQLTGYAQLLRGVLSAFLLYKGFVFLQEQARMAIGELVNLQHELGIIQTQLLDVGQDFRLDIRTNILDIAAETGVSMVELAKAEFEVVSANIAVADSYEILELAAKAAVSGGLEEVELAFNAALSTVNAFNRSNIEFGVVFDQQFQVIRRGIFTYEQYATVVGTVGEAFASMGQDIETVNASLAAVSLVFTGKQLERGATGLRNAVLRLSEAPEDFEELGVRIRDNNGDFRNFIDIGRDLQRVLGGLSESARARAIKDLFPDERERRGINAFLGNLDQAEQFFIEQQFAAGSLEDAYETVNDSLKTQANILRQEVTPGLESVVSIADALLTVINGIDDALPGINKNLAATAAIAAVIGGGVLISGGRVSLRNRLPIQGPLAPGQTTLGLGAATPTGAGFAAGGLVAGTQFFAGQRQGALQSGDFLGAALTGGATGAFMGGPIGAAIGAAVSIGALALGQAFEKEGPEVAKSFSESFTEALKANGGDIASAFAQSIIDESIGGSAEFQNLLQGQEQFFAGQRLVRTFSGDTSSVAARLGITTEEAGRLIRGETQRVQLTPGQAERLSPSQRRLLETEMLPGTDVQAGILAAFEEAAAQVRQIPTQVGTEEQRRTARVIALNEAVERNLDLTEEQNQNLVGFIDDLIDAGISTDQAGQVLQTFADEGALAAHKLLLSFNEMEEGARGFTTVVAEFDTLFIGEAEVAADVFRHMGAEGEKLADVFTEISRVTQAFSLLQQLQEFEVRDPAVSALIQSNETRLAETRAEIRRLESFEGPLTPEAQRRLEAFRNAETALVGRGTRLESRETRSLLESLFGPDAATEVGDALLTQLQGLVGGIDGEFTPQDLLDALFATVDEGLKEELEELQLGANSLANRLFDASEAVRDGLIDGLGFTGDELEMFGEELQALNKLVAQRSIIEEIRNIASFVFPEGSEAPFDFDALFADLRQEMIQGGKAFFEMMSDPAKLAELLTNLEFGDIEVDNSTDNNFVVRVSGDVSPSQLRALEEAIVNGMNRANRERRSR